MAQPRREKLPVGAVPEEEWGKYWRARRRYRWWLLVLVLGYMPAIGLVGLVAHILGQHPDRWMKILMYPYFIIMFCVMWSGFAYRCPRCGKPFGRRRTRFGLLGGFLPAKCMNCGLPRGATEDPRA